MDSRFFVPPQELMKIKKNSNWTQFFLKLIKLLKKIGPLGRVIVPQTNILSYEKIEENRLSLFKRVITM